MQDSAPQKPKIEFRILAEDEISKLVQESVTLQSAEDIDAALSDRGRIDFPGQMRQMAEDCDDILTKSGWPRTLQPILHDAHGNWREFSGNLRDASGGWRLTRGALFVQELTRDFSNAWYAARIGFKIRLLLEHIEKPDIDPSGINVMVWEIATLWADLRWRGLHKNQIVTGRKQRESLKSRRDQQNLRKKNEVQERRVLVGELALETKLKGGALDRWLVAELAKRYGISVSDRTIRADRRALSL